MATQPQYEDFDFTKKINNKINKQSYKKLSFLMIGCTVLALSVNVGSHAILNKIEKENTIQEQQKQLFVQDIKQMDEKEFSNMLEYISKNVDMYDAKVNFVQEVINKADREETSRFTISTDNAESLGKYLTEYKSKVKEDIAELIKVRKSVSHNIDVPQKEVDIFFNYMGAYKSKTALSDKNIDNKIHEVVYNAKEGNNHYNQENHVYDTLKNFDHYIKDFEFVGETQKQTTTLKPKI
jgi:hypothetical protein